MSKHTPAPWTIDGRIRTSINAGRKHVAMVNFYNSTDPKSNVSGEEHEANARLIAASPEILSALKACRLELDYCADQLSYLGRTGGDKGSVAIALRDARAAIDKAEGK